MKDKMKQLWANTFVREIVIILVLAIVFSLVIQSMIQRSYVDGSSMEPNLNHNQHIIISKIVYWFGEPERGDIIVFTPPEFLASDNDYIKRVIGLPGESVEIKDGIVYIRNGDDNMFQLAEPYITEQASSTFVGDTIPANEYFVLGDNRNNSDDSRRGWTLPQENIIGKAWLTIWPPARWGLFSDRTYEE